MVTNHIHGEPDGSPFLRKTCGDRVARLDEAGPGVIAGYAARYGNLDRDGEIIDPGAFAGSLDSFVERGFLSLAHRWDSGIGTIRRAREDNAGLWIEAEFHSDEESQRVRHRVVERLARGKKVGLSVGFRVLRSRRVGGVPHIVAGELVEVAIVTVPANPLAEVAQAKWAGERLRRLRLEAERLRL